MLVDKGQNEHERLIASYARKSFSAAGLFHPTPWKKRGEPADLVLKVGRSVFLFYMTRTKQWFETACLHNLDQAAKHIGHWRDGFSIRGANDFRSYNVAWNDIDNIVVVSVVDGEDSGCCHHHPDFVGHREKLACVVTISGEVLEFLAEFGGGAPELVILCNHLCATPGRLTSKEVICALRGVRDALYRNAWQQRPVFDEGPPPSLGELQRVKDLVLRRIRATFLSVGDSGRFDWLTDVLCQVGWLERSIIASVVSEAASRIWSVKQGEHGMQFCYIDYLNLPLKFGIGVGTASTMAAQAEAHAAIRETKQLDFQWFFTTDFNAIGGLIIGGKSPPSVLDVAVTTLRKSLAV